jgi:hypothetical protein
MENKHELTFLKLRRKILPSWTGRFLYLCHMAVNPYTSRIGKLGLKYFCDSDFEPFCTLDKSTDVNLKQRNSSYCSKQEKPP